MQVPKSLRNLFEPQGQGQVKAGSQSRCFILGFSGVECSQAPILIDRAGLKSFRVKSQPRHKLGKIATPGQLSKKPGQAALSMSPQCFCNPLGLQTKVPKLEPSARAVCVYTCMCVCTCALTWPVTFVLPQPGC